MSVVLLSTVHGSRLYNLAHEGSDHDAYVVIDKSDSRKSLPGRQAKATYARQSVGEVDTFTCDLSTWLKMCAEGVPQALEAMFSPCADTDTLAALRSAYRASERSLDTYLRTMKAFAYWDKEDQYKRKRHALRLALNLASLCETRRFNPVLSDDEATYVSYWAHASPDRVYAHGRSLAGF